MALSGSGRKRKGARNELRVLHYLEEKGYTCTKAGGSLGAWDIIAIAPHRILLIQVKSNRPPSGAEMDILDGFKCPQVEHVRKLVVVVMDGEPVARAVTFPPDRRSERACLLELV